jgi:alpha-1,6-mannosyltransferase
MGTSPTAVRWIGLLGSALLGAAAYVGGDFPTLIPGTDPITIATGPNGVLIYALWISGTATLCTAWWYGLRHVGRELVTTRWVIGTVVLWMLPMIVCPPTGSRDVYSYACQGALVAAGHSPYVEGVSALPCPWLESVSPIWRDTPAPYGPLFLMLAGIAARLGSLTAALAFIRVLAIGGVTLMASALTVLARRMSVPVDRALWLVLACPLVVLHLVGGAHNDAITVGLLLAGFAVLAARPERLRTLLLGGVLLGLAVSVKTTVVVVLPFGALLAAGGADARILVRRGGAVIGAALGTLSGLSVASGFGFGWLTALSHAGDSVVWTSPPTAVGLAIGYVGRGFGVRLHAESVTRLIALILLPVALAAILWVFRRRDPLQGAAIALLAVIFFAPIDQPWYLVWPLAMFAATRGRLRWFTIAVVIASSIEMPDGSGLTKIIQLPASLAMTAVVVWVCTRVPRWLRGLDIEPADFESAGFETAESVATQAFPQLRGVTGELSVGSITVPTHARSMEFGSGRGARP